MGELCDHGSRENEYTVNEHERLARRIQLWAIDEATGGSGRWWGSLDKKEEREVEGLHSAAGPQILYSRIGDTPPSDFDHFKREGKKTQRLLPKGKSPTAVASRGLSRDCPISAK